MTLIKKLGIGLLALTAGCQVAGQDIDPFGGVSLKSKYLTVNGMEPHSEPVMQSYLGLSTPIGKDIDAYLLGWQSQDLASGVRTEGDGIIGLKNDDLNIRIEGYDFTNGKDTLNLVGSGTLIHEPVKVELFAATVLESTENFYIMPSVELPIGDTQSLTGTLGYNHNHYSDKSSVSHTGIKFKQELEDKLGLKKGKLNFEVYLQKGFREDIGDQFLMSINYGF